MVANLSRLQCAKAGNWMKLPSRHSLSMLTSSNGNIFRLTGHLCGEFTGPGEFPTQRPVTRSFYGFFFICAWINGWVNNRGAGDLRRSRAHYDVNVMLHSLILKMRTWLVRQIWLTVNIVWTYSVLCRRHDSKINIPTDFPALPVSIPTGESSMSLSTHIIAIISNQLL